MYQIQTEGNGQVFRQMPENQHTGFFQAAPVSYVLNSIPNLPSPSMACSHIPQPPPSDSFPLYDDTLNYMQQYWMFSMSGVPPQAKQELNLTLPATSTQLLQTTLRSYEQVADYMNILPRPNGSTAKVARKTLKQTVSSEGLGIGCSMAVTGDETEAGSVPAGDMGHCHLRNPTSFLLKSESGVGGNGSQRPLEDALQKRELRLMKNREAARECRRKKKEYVRCLENRVAVLEQQNKTLIEELRALKDIYRHKVE